MFYFSLGILILTEGAFLYWQRRSFRFQVSGFMFHVSWIVIFGLLFFQSWQQYQVWSQNELSKFLLPPYQPIAYFLGYSFTHFFKNYLISLVIALLFLSAAVFLNKKFPEKFFEKEEPYLGAIAIFLVGHPLWIYYLIAILIIGLFGTLFFQFKWRARFPFYHFWLPLAISVLIIGKVLI